MFDGLKNNEEVVSNINNIKGFEAMKYKNKTITYRENDNRWFVRFRRNGKQISIYGKTQQECLQKLKKALAEKQTVLLQAPIEILTFKNWIDNWFKLYKSENKETTTNQQKNNINKYLFNLFDKELTKITSEDLQETISNISAPRQKEKIVTLLKDIFTRAYELRKIEFNPTLTIKIKKHKSEETKAFTIKEQQIFEKLAYKYNAPTLLIQLYQGLRPGEAYALTKEDFNFERNTITINKAYNQKGELSSPKTYSSIREIPIFKNTLKLLEYFRFSEKENIFNHSRDSAENTFSKICKNGNLIGYTQRSLRHTFGTRGAELGISSKVIQQWLGHSTITTTLKYYTHINNEFEIQEKEKFNTFFDTQTDTQKN